MSVSVAVRASWVAMAAHLEQVDKAGNAYITHPARMAAHLNCADEDTQAVAWLHDVVEDSSASIADLRTAGFPEQVLAAVAALTKRDDQTLEDYCATVRANPIALVVKKVDLADNTDPARLELLDVVTRERLIGKYARMHTLLAR